MLNGLVPIYVTDKHAQLMIEINSHSIRSRVITCMMETRFKYTNSGAKVHWRLVYIYLLNVPSFSSRYFNKIKRTSRLGRLLALSLEILSLQASSSFEWRHSKHGTWKNVFQNQKGTQCVEYLRHKCSSNARFSIWFVPLGSESLHGTSYALIKHNGE